MNLKQFLSATTLLLFTLVTILFTAYEESPISENDLVQTIQSEDVDALQKIQSDDSKTKLIAIVQQAKTSKKN